MMVVVGRSGRHLGGHPISSGQRIGVDVGFGTGRGQAATTGSHGILTIGKVQSGPSASLAGFRIRDLHHFKSVLGAVSRVRRAQSRDDVGTVAGEEKSRGRDVRGLTRGPEHQRMLVVGGVTVRHLRNPTNQLMRIPIQTGLSSDRGQPRRRIHRRRRTRRQQGLTRARRIRRGRTGHPRGQTGFRIQLDIFRRGFRLLAGFFFGIIAGRTRGQNVGDLKGRVLPRFLDGIEPAHRQHRHRRRGRQHQTGLIPRGGLTHLGIQQPLMVLLRGRDGGGGSFLRRARLGGVGGLRSHDAGRASREEWNRSRRSKTARHHPFNPDWEVDENPKPGKKSSWLVDFSELEFQRAVPLWA